MLLSEPSRFVVEAALDIGTCEPVAGKPVHIRFPSWRNGRHAHMKRGRAMPRAGRKIADSGYYHVILKGDGGMDLFDADADRQKFLKMPDGILEASRLRLIAWCLMSNHVHMLLEDTEQELSACMHRLTTAYAMYFNKRAQRHGSVFQERIFSVPIKTDRQLIACVLYIHDNPLKGMGVHPSCYRWCSYAECADGSAIRCSTDTVLGMLGGRQGFLKASEDLQRRTYFVVSGAHIADDDIASAARMALEGKSPAVVATLPVKLRRDAVCALRDIGLTAGQVARLTGMGARMIVRDSAKGLKRSGQRRGRSKVAPNYPVPNEGIRPCRGAPRPNRSGRRARSSRRRGRSARGPARRQPTVPDARSSGRRGRRPRRTDRSARRPSYRNR